MHGGVKVYRGHARGAREYLDQECPRAEDYYLAEPEAFAQRYTVDANGHVIELAGMNGDAYEAWVGGFDPDTAEPRGQLRHDARAVRFVEMTVNGPKSWSLAAELHPDVAAAYDAAQDRAAEQIIGWLGQNATARVGPRGQQVATAVEMLEAVTVRHQTSRAGDPHRHLHLQINARVFAKGQWRGLDTVAIRDSIAAINGIGHAAVATDPAFRDALAAHGYTLTGSGEITQLARYVGAFSKRAAQIERNLARYEKAWRVEHPGEEPGPVLRRVWDARAWAEGRPDKIAPISWGDVHDRWLDELTRLGYTDRDHQMLLLTPPVGAIDRDQAVGIVLSRLGAGRSAWNAADIRGEVEHHLARTGIATDAAVRPELAEDLTARAIDRCVRLLDRDGVPEHIRALTSPLCPADRERSGGAARCPGRRTRPRPRCPRRRRSRRAVTGLSGFRAGGRRRHAGRRSAAGRDRRRRWRRQNHSPPGHPQPRHRAGPPTERGDPDVESRPSRHHRTPDPGEFGRETRPRPRVPLGCRRHLDPPHRW
jgi:conjugative relaxase-like TrwC/TraI family protein